MTTEIITAKDKKSVIPIETYTTNSSPIQCHPLNDVLTSGFMNEVIATVKADRINTKQAILADISSTARVQNQNGQVITACEQELQRKDLSEKSRIEILRYMSRAAESTSNQSVASREFQSKQLEHSHKLLWELFVKGIMIVFVAVNVTLLQNAAIKSNHDNHLRATAI